MNKISVVIPLFNAEKYIVETIQSVLDQSLMPYEIVIVDDGSQDKGSEKAKFFLDQNLFKNYKILKTVNQGHSKAANLGAREASGDYIAFLDSDDLWKKNKIKDATQLIDQGDISILFSKFEFIDSFSLPLTRMNYYQDFNPNNFWRQLLYKGNLVYGSNSGVVIRRDLFLSSDGYDETLPACEDWDLWIRLAAAHRYSFIPEVLVSIRVHDQNQSSSKSLMLRSRINVVKKHAKDIEIGGLSLLKVIVLILSLQGRDVFRMFFSNSYVWERKELETLTRFKFFRSIVFVPLCLEILIRSLRNKLRKYSF